MLPPALLVETATAERTVPVSVTVGHCIPAGVTLLMKALVAIVQIPDHTVKLAAVIALRAASEGVAIGLCRSQIMRTNGFHKHQQGNERHANSSLFGIQHDFNL